MTNYSFITLRYYESTFQVTLARIEALGALKRRARAAADDGATTLYPRLFERPARAKAKNHKPAPAPASPVNPTPEPQPAAS